MYDVIKFFGTPSQLLAYTRNLRVAELLEQSYEQNVKPNLVA